MVSRRGRPFLTGGRSRPAENGFNQLLGVACKEHARAATPWATMNLATTMGSRSLSFETLVREYYEALRHFALRLTRCPETADDLTQQTFYLALKHQDHLRDQRRVRSWLHRILHREFLQGLCRKQRAAFTSLEETETDDSGSAVQHVERLDAQTAMDALLGIEERFRLPLALFYLEDLSYREIATRLQIPLGTVMSRLSRGKQMLRARLFAPAN